MQEKNKRSSNTFGFIKNLFTFVNHKHQTALSLLLDISENNHTNFQINFFLVSLFKAKTYNRIFLIAAII